MATLVAGKPFRTRMPTLLVENVLAAGRVAFELVVVDDQGNVSHPVRLLVTVTPVRKFPVPVPAPAPIPLPVQKPVPEPLPVPTPLKPRTRTAKPKTKPPARPT